MRVTANIALDDGFPAVGAPGRPRAFQTGHVANIDVAQSLGAGGVACSDQRFDGRRGQVREFVLRMEARKMQRPVRPQLFHNPAAHPPDGVGVVRVGWHD